jgi:hypothetical protein
MRFIKPTLGDRNPIRRSARARAAGSPGSRESGEGGARKDREIAGMLLPLRRGRKKKREGRRLG